MFKSLDIHKHMEVVGSDGKHVGTPTGATPMNICFWG